MRWYEGQEAIRDDEQRNAKCEQATEVRPPTRRSLAPSLPRQLREYKGGLASHQSRFVLLKGLRLYGTYITLHYDCTFVQ